MIFEINSQERKLLLSLKNGIEEVNIYKSGIYPTVVIFRLVGGKKVTIRARDEGIAPRFEVFPISVSEEEINGEPDQVIGGLHFSGNCNIYILQKSEWSINSSEDEKEGLIGNPTGATTQYEGRSSEIPAHAINQATLHAGIKVEGKSGQSLIVATSMFPFALYVTDCEFSESVDENIYESEILC